MSLTVYVVVIPYVSRLEVNQPVMMEMYLDVMVNVVDVIDYVYTEYIVVGW